MSQREFAAPNAWSGPDGRPTLEALQWLGRATALLNAPIEAEIESAGENITIPAGSTLAEALQVILDAIDP